MQSCYPNLLIKTSQNPKIVNQLPTKHQQQPTQRERGITITFGSNPIASLHLEVVNCSFIGFKVISSSTKLQSSPLLETKALTALTFYLLLLCPNLPLPNITKETNAKSKNRVSSRTPHQKINIGDH